MGIISAILPLSLWIYFNYASEIAIVSLQYCDILSSRLNMKKKKLLYVPGLISLIGLPVILFLIPLKSEVRHNAIRMSLPSEEKRDDTSVIRFTKATLENTLQGKKVEQVYLYDNHGYDGDIDKYLLSRKLVFIRSEMERL